MAGLGYSFSPSGDVPMNNRGRNGGPSFGPQEAIRMLSLRIPKAAGPSAIAPSELLNSQGGAGVPNLNSILMQLVQAFAPPHQPGVPALSTPSQPGPVFNQQASYQPQAPSQQRPSGFNSPGVPTQARPSIPLPRIIPGAPSQAPQPMGGMVGGREEVFGAPPPQAIDNGLFDDAARGPRFRGLPYGFGDFGDFDSLF